MTLLTKQNYQTRPAIEADKQWLLKLRLETMSETIEASGLTLSSKEQMARINRYFNCIEIVTFEGKDIGMLKVIRESEVWRLEQVQIVPRYQGLGVGALLVKELLQQTKEKHIPLTLSVLKNNPAKRLYSRLGFKVVAEGNNSYDMVWKPGPIK